MNYGNPFGVDSKDGQEVPYVNGDETTGEGGSRLDAAVFEAMMREILAVIDAGGLVRDKNNLAQMAAAIPIIAQRATYKSLDGTLNLSPQGVLGVACQVNTLKAMPLTDNVIRPVSLHSVFYTTITADTAYRFDNAVLADLSDNVWVTVEVHVNMPTAYAISFDPAPEWERGKAPNISKSGKDYWFVFRTKDRGAHWYASLGSEFNAY